MRYTILALALLVGCDSPTRAEWKNQSEQQAAVVTYLARVLQQSQERLETLEDKAKIKKKEGLLPVMIVDTMAPKAKVDNEQRFPGGITP